MIRIKAPISAFIRLAAWFVGIGLTAGSAVGAGATPEYAAREGKTCQYCHTSSSPGFVDPKTGVRETADRNGRGVYYETHRHTFEGYVEKVNATPLLHFLWKQDLMDLPRRAAVGDVVGDGKPRLILLDEKPGQTHASALTIRHWDGKAFVTEFTGDVQAGADKLAVGRFAGEAKPAVIATEDALWLWNGKTFVRRPTSRPLSIFGVARLKDGQERLLLSDGPTQIKAYQVSASGQLSEGLDAPASKQVLWEDMHATPGYFNQIGLGELGSGGVIGLWDTHKFADSVLYYAKMDQDFDVKPDPKNPNQPLFVLKSSRCSVVLCDPYKSLTLLSTPSLPGTIYDISVENPQGDGKPGLLILGSESPTGKGRSLYFFALE